MCVRVINNLILQSFNPNIKFLRKYEIQVFKTKIFKRVRREFFKKYNKKNTNKTCVW